MILGVDPGRDKAGWAFVSREGDLMLSGIFPAREIEAFLDAFACPAAEREERLAGWTLERCPSVSGLTAEPEYVALGDGVGSRAMMPRFERLGSAVLLVNEEGTTLAARVLYWRLHRPSLWQRCLPSSLRFPPRYIDDLAAWAIALRSLAIPFL